VVAVLELVMEAQELLEQQTWVVVVAQVAAHHIHRLLQVVQAVAELLSSHTLAHNNL
jgi:hypothetical protein